MIDTKNLSALVRKKVDRSRPDDWLNFISKIEHFDLKVRVLHCIHNSSIGLTILEYEDIDKYEVVGGNFPMVLGYICQKYKLESEKLF